MKTKKTNSTWWRSMPGLVLLLAFATGMPLFAQSQPASNPTPEGDLLAYLQQASIQQQEQHWIMEARFKSYLLAGFGHFQSGKNVEGALLVAGDLIIGIGGVLLSAITLPNSVRPGVLDYFGSSLGEIETAWRAVSLTDLAPSMAISAASASLVLVLRLLAASDAQNAAREAIKTGTVRFEPDLSVLLAPAHRENP